MSDNVVPPGNVTGAWHPDPSGRHQYRWWDGEVWTGLIANDGVTGIDQLAPATAPATSAAPAWAPVAGAAHEQPSAAPPAWAAGPSAPPVPAREVRRAVGPLEAVRVGFRRYADFGGRAGRAEFWWWRLFSTLALLAPVGLAAATESGAFALLAIGAFLVLLVPDLSVGCRRLHDTGRSGAWLWLAFAPFGGLVLLFLFCGHPDPGPNAYGPAPS
jgi:uncharacterized membrane protein YhaH (DUF805 family)